MDSNSHRANYMAANTSQTISLAARVLLLFCRTPGTPDYPMSGVHYQSGKELDRLCEVFPDFSRELRDKVVIDFGCGLGYQSVAFAQAGARQVIGVDISEDGLRVARQRIRDQGLEDKIKFVARIPDDLKADVIVSQNSFEHFLEPAEILGELRRALAPGGQIFITFAPPWYAPWGAHMTHFCKLPWVQLLFSERTIMEARSLFRADGARTYHDSGLAQMSLAKFENVVASSGLHYAFKRYDCSRGLDWIQGTPLRELFVNRVSCTLMLS
jgi:SAM-dependent methyltransferase